MRGFTILLALCAGASVLPAAPTYHGQIAELLAKHCGACHQPNGMAPFALRTYAEVRPWARSIRAQVVQRLMPPFDAADAAGHFRNDTRLTLKEIALIRTWVDAGAPEGKARAQSSPAPPALMSPPPDPKKSDWDLTLTAPEQRVDGITGYRHLQLPYSFARGQWVQAVEIVPGNRAVVHHAVLFVRPPQSVWMRDASLPKPELVGLSAADEVLATYLPGAATLAFPEGRAKWIPAGSDLILQMHYTPPTEAPTQRSSARQPIRPGKVSQPVGIRQQASSEGAIEGGITTDQTQVRLRFSRSAVQERVVTLSVAQGKLQIPPGAPNHRERATFTLQTGVKILALTPHLHYRGKAMHVSAQLPPIQGEELVRLLTVPRYRFDWQIRYELAQPVEAARGTILQVEAVYDNSPGNPRNPDPTATVVWGDQSWEEMLVCFVDVLIPAGLPIEEIYRPKRF